MNIERSERGNGLRRQTKLVRGGLARSGFDETAEAIYLTSGYVYPSAEEAEAAFKGNIDRYIYSRYGNPTVTMFEQRLCDLEGTQACRATASGMAAVFASLMCQLKAGDRGRLLPRTLRVVPLHRCGDPATLRHRDCPG